jgi:chemotaxis regulatin CheY-phosphate phosphatase CheZ
MRHIDLIEIIYKNREIIDQAFRGDTIDNPPKELTEEVTIFQKVAKKYELNTSYIDFANTMLKRISANYTFGDYNEEIKLLVRLKEDYLQNQKKDILNRMKDLVKTLYKKVEIRDIAINAKVNDIILDAASDLEIILKEAEDVAKRIDELMIANSTNQKVLGVELREIDDEFNQLLTDISIDLYILSENIYGYHQRLSEFILQTEKTKRQNKKIASLGNKILKEDDRELEMLLISRPERYYHTIEDSRKGFIKHILAKEETSKKEFINNLSSQIDVVPPKRKAPTSYKPYSQEEAGDLKGINIKKIQNDIIQSKPNDMFLFILAHNEIEKFKIDNLDLTMAFKTFMTIVQEGRENIILSENYNTYRIKEIKWI